MNLTFELELNASVSSSCYLSTNQRIAIYSASAMAAVVLNLFKTLLFYFICINASRVLHNWMFGAVLRAPVRFFDINPIGLQYSSTIAVLYVKVYRNCLKFDSV